ncbi:hypothetical protein FF1_028563 [Malus domestica]
MDLLEKTLMGIFVAMIVAIAISKLRGRRLTISCRHRHSRYDCRLTDLAKKFDGAAQPRHRLLAGAHQGSAPHPGSQIRVEGGVAVSLGVM